jgi:2Fe-2S ferredoxin
MISINVIRRSGEHATLTAQTGDTLMQVLFDADLDIEARCGGCASCATCHVYVAPEWMDKLPARDEIEEMLLQYEEHYDQKRSRLSCQLKLDEALSGLQVEVAPEE